MPKDFSSHPAAEQWDGLRAGIAGEQTEMLTRHLAQCESCRAQFGFGAAMARELEPVDTDLARELRLRRRQALAQAQERSPRRLSLVAGVAALALGATLYLGWHHQTAVAPLASNTHSNDADVYADVDFYLWLSEQESHHADNPS